MGDSMAASGDSNPPSGKDPELYRQEIDEHGAQREARYGVSDKDQHRGQIVDHRPVLDRLHDPKRDADQIGEDGGDQAIIERDRKPVRDHAQHRFVVSEGFAEIEPDGLAEPFAIGLEQWLVEAIIRLQLLQLVVRNIELDARAPSAFAAATGKLQAKLVDRAAGDELAQQIGHEGDADESRNHQQEPPQHIIAQGFAA